MKRSTLRVLLTRAGHPAPRGYFAARTCADRNVESDIRAPITPWPTDAAAMASKRAALVAARDGAL